MRMTSTELAPKLSTASIKKSWDVYTAFEWPESIPDDVWCMSPELISIYGTDVWEGLAEQQQKRLSFTELCNFFSLVLDAQSRRVDLHLKK